MINAEITVKFNASNLITQTELDNWFFDSDDGEGGITLLEYVRFMINEQMFFDIIDDLQPKLVSVNIRPTSCLTRRP